MRVAFVAPRFAPDIGGVETHVHELAVRMVAQGVAVEVLVQTADRDLPRVERLDGIVVRRFRVALPSVNFAVAPTLPWFIARNSSRYDVIHLHSYHALPSLWGALTAGATPVVFTPHYHGVGHSRLRSALHRPYRLVGRRLFARCDRVICVSRAEASLVTAHFPDVADRIVVIPNGIETADLTSARPFDEPRHVVLTAGRWEGYKNVHVVVEAMTELDSSWVLRIVGDGPAEDQLRELVSARGLGSRVDFCKRVDRPTLCRWYRTASVYVNISREEAFGITALEAVAAGARVVVSDIPAHREVLRDYAGGCGRLVSLPVSPPELAEHIRAAASGKDADTPISVPNWDEVERATLDAYEAAGAIAAVKGR